MGKKN